MQCHRHAAQSSFSGVRAGIVGFDSLSNLKIVFFRVSDDRLLVSFLFLLLYHPYPRPQSGDCHSKASPLMAKVAVSLAGRGVGTTF